ncbi:class III extradiol dioxygenase subunit B-like domain-containing protein [Catenulispora subtropica]|uniref:Class III extradiol dioxygenase subunit B-like domain-containing protein n=1 Tax=Catenulispora subtropica TaxID=450798 RepID=A0ABN2QJP8_9ACTN
MIAAAVVPHPPVLVPRIAQGFAPDLDGLRAACGAAIDQLYAAEPDELLVVGAGPEQSTDIAATGDFHEYGLDLAVDGRWEPAGKTPMTLPFLIGAWLLRDRPGVPVRRAVMVDENGGLDAGSAGAAGRVAMLVLGDGSASRTLQAPGHLDERAEPYDASVARALATADTEALAALDPELSRQLHVAGLPAWRALAAAADASGVEYDAELLYEDAPYGVGYFVATWLAR